MSTAEAEMICDLYHDSGSLLIRFCENMIHAAIFSSQHHKESFKSGRCYSTSNKSYAAVKPLKETLYKSVHWYKQCAWNTRVFDGEYVFNTDTYSHARFLIQMKLPYWVLQEMVVILQTFYDILKDSLFKIIYWFKFHWRLCRWVWFTMCERFSR